MTSFERSAELAVPFVIALALLTIGGCSCSTTTTGTVDAAPRIDGADDDGGSEVDGGSDVDAAHDDAALADAGSDAATSDSGPRPDAGMCVDLPAEPTRPVPIQCSPCRPPGPGGGSGDCVTDADCTAGDNGRCVFGRIGAFCEYDDCFGDDDCNAMEVCLCDGSRSGTGGGNVCVSAECRVDADCADGFACSPTLGGCGHYTNFVAYRCHRATDACTTDADCGAGYCAFDEVLGHWACSTTECAG